MSNRGLLWRVFVWLPLSAVILWRKLAEVVEKYVHKGDKLYIEGRLRYSTYDDKQGQRRYVTEIWADNMEMLNGRTSADNQ